MFERLTALGACVSFSTDENRVVFTEMRKLLPFLDYEGMELCWASGLMDTGIQAVYRWQTPDLVFVRPPATLAVKVPVDRQLDYRRSAIRLMLPSIVHELTHRKQFKTMGRLKYWACSVPGLYYPLLDAEAFEAEAGAAKTLGLAQGEYAEFGKGGRR